MRLTLAEAKGFAIRAGLPKNTVYRLGLREGMQFDAVLLLVSWARQGKK